MKRFPQYVGAAALAGLCLVGHSGPAAADTRFICDMKGTWIEAAEDWLFSADYISHPAGADSFTGVFANPKAGATANVVGNALQGTWTIILNYTDAGHPGWVKRLIGTGRKDNVSHELVVTGDFTLSKSGTQTGSGKFRLHGKCKSR